MQGSGSSDISMFGLKIDILRSMERMSSCVSLETQHMVQSAGTLGTSSPICPWPQGSQITLRHDQGNTQLYLDVKKPTQKSTRRRLV